MNLTFWNVLMILDDLLCSPGTVGDSLSSSQNPDVFVSSDGGYNWRGTLRGPHHYSILDSGGLIVAVEAHREGQAKTIKYWAVMHNETIVGNGGQSILVLLCSHFSSPDSPRTRAGAGSPITSPSSPYSSRAWRPSRGPRPWMSACGASARRTTASPCGWSSPLTSRASSRESVSQNAYNAVYI